MDPASQALSRPRSRLWAGVWALVVAVAAIAAVVLWGRWLASWHAPADKSGRLLIATLGVTGVVVTSAVGLLGIWLRHSIERRAAQLAEFEAARAEAEQHRLRTETALRMVELLDANIDSDAGVARASAGVLMLSRLGDTDLALDLVSELWPHGRVSPSAAVRVINDGLTSESQMGSEAAATLLLNNVDRLDVGEHMYEWPDSAYDTWPTALPTSTRILLCLTLSRWLSARAPVKNEDFRLRLLREAESDEAEEVRAIANGWSHP